VRGQDSISEIPPGLWRPRPGLWSEYVSRLFPIYQII